MALWLRYSMVVGLAAAFVACSSDSQRRQRGSGGEGGEAGEAGTANASGGNAGRTAGSAGTRSAGGSNGKGGSAGTTNGEGGSDESAGAPSGEGGEPAGQAGGAGSSGTGGSGGSDTNPECEAIDCSGHGTCVANAGVAHCECDAGYGAIGLDCVACQTVSGTLDIDVPMVTISGALSVNGAPVSAPYATFRFVTAEGDAVYGADLSLGSYSTQMLPGTYDIVYNATDFAQGVPANFESMLRKGVVIDESGTLDIDVPSVTVSGRLSVNGSAPGGAGDGAVYFARGGALVARAGVLSAPDYAVDLIPGEYDIVYHVLTPDTAVPANEFAVLREDVEVDEDFTLDIDIPMIEVEGLITVNGATTTTAAETSLSLRNAAGDAVRLGGVTEGSYSASLVPGTFDLVYMGGVDPGVVPENSFATLARDLSIEDDRTLNIDVPMVTLTGNVTINGEAHVSNPGDARLSFTNDDDDFVDLADTGAATYTASVIPGTYDLLYDAHTFEDDGLPDNQFGNIRSGVVVDEDGTLDLDIPMLTVTGAVTVGGDPASGGAATFYFVNPENADTVIAATLAESSYTAEFLPGTYDAFYGFQQAGAGLPVNYGLRILEGVELEASRTLDLDVPQGVNLSGVVSVNGEAVPSGVDSQITLRRGAAEYADLVNLAAPSYDVEVMPGTYLLVYESRIWVPGVPANIRGTLACVQIE